MSAFIKKLERWVARKDSKKKGNFIPISCMNIDANIPNKLLQTKLNSTSKTQLYHGQVDFISGMQEWFNI